MARKYSQQSPERLLSLPSEKNSKANSTHALIPLDTAKQVAVYSEWLAQKAASSSTRQREQSADQYVDDALKPVTVKGREISTFAPFRYHLSALHTLTRAQLVILALSALFLLLSVILWGVTPLVVLLGILMVLYLGDLLFTFLLSTQTLNESSGDTISDKVVHRLAEAEWPRYTILCPLYREVAVVPQFVRAMQHLDYPDDKLQILFLTEEDDAETRDAIANMNLPSHFSIVTVPDGEPRTKPRACNYGLLQATGEYIVIYDAEDVPDPLQLKKAVLAFAHHGPEVACVQAKLNFYNPQQNILTRWFTAEYSLWFDLTLPGLQRAKLPLPLGGTSNHFRAETLRLLGAWDPFNVTEDCDLGQRLAHFHMRTAVLDSTTYEEANSRVKNWIRQRSRWIKGYMQTYLVYMRNPWPYLRPGRLREFLSLQLVIGAKTAVLFLNPLMWLLLIAYVFLRPFVSNAYHLLFPRAVLYMGSVCLVFGNFFYVYSHMVGCMRRDRADLVKWTLLIPIYWAMTSMAGFLALFQLIFKPHYWEKTQHGLHLQSSTHKEEDFLAQRVLPRASSVPGTPTIASISASTPSTGTSSGPITVSPLAAAVVTDLPVSSGMSAQSLFLALRARQKTAARRFWRDPWLVVLLVLSCLAGLAALVYFFQTDQILTYGDSYSHLLIARRIIDSATPGLAQVGGVWLPLPHMLMLPFIWNDYLWYTGLAGAFVGLPCYVVSCLYLFLAARRITHANAASFVGTLLFALNPNVLYLQATPLSEIVLIAGVMMACYHFIAWTQDDDFKQLILAALGTCLASMSRYDGWFLFLAFLGMILLIGWLKRQRWARIEGNLLTFATLGGLGIALWILWCAAIFGDPLYWQRGPFSSQAQQQSLIKLNILYTYHNAWQSLRYFTLDSIANVGLVTFALGAFAFLLYLFRRHLTADFIAGLAFVVPFIFYVVSLYDGQAALYVTSAVPSSVPNGLYNARYGVQSVPPAAFFVSLLLARLYNFLWNPNPQQGGTATRRRFPATVQQLFSRVEKGWTVLASFLAKNAQRVPAQVGSMLLSGVFTCLILWQSLWTFSDGIVSLQDGLYGLDCAPPHQTVVFLTQHYNGGRILEDTFTSPVAQIPFKNVIYEGSGSLWTSALANPTAWIEWILVDPNNKDDLVATHIDVTDPAFTANYTALVKEPKGLTLFRRRGLPPLPNNVAATNLLHKHELCGKGDPHLRK